jgi:2-iminobutanoate/2-iminopropanoate deaminase
LGILKPAFRAIATSEAPAAIGPYSQAIEASGFVFTAGQIPLDPATMQITEGDITAQTEQVMRNIQAVLEAAGTSFARVVKTTCFLADLGDFVAFNEVYARFFGESAPARSTVQVSALPRGVMVEMDCVALAGERE